MAFAKEARIRPCRNPNQNCFICAASMLSAAHAADLVRRNVAGPQLGLISTNGQIMVQTFDGSAEAIEAFRRLERAKRRCGYAALDEKLPSSGNFSGYGDVDSICSTALMSDEQNRNKTEFVS
ncbi:WGR domain-containing protein [Bradyrhizobium sp. Ghvi]|uniref:WGR domain-containing protein n=1 Tax=Bradyrhizobium sp. Ghvi TaxID=1855319 RepID=UPI001FCDE4FD|nr:WGR domain-containing protein [Bradyrhizobium sp. Ghvi]